jgi:hypothetical protein
MMGAPYSDDLHKKVIQACKRRSQSQREIAELFSVSISFVESVWRHYARYAANRLKFVDESGLNIAMTRHYGRVVCGQRIRDAAPKNFVRNLTILGSLSWHGLDAVITVDGAADAEVFRAYVSRVLTPTLRPGDVVVMNNFSAHKVTGIEQAFISAGAKLIYLPPNSLD